MSSIADSRVPNGLGILPLQHSGYLQSGGALGRWSLDMRASVLATRITGRLDTDGNIGHWTYDKFATGDLVGGFCWLAAGRAPGGLAGWSFAWPSETVKGQGTQGGGQITPEPYMLPLADHIRRGYIADVRYDKIPYQVA